MPSFKADDVQWVNGRATERELEFARAKIIGRVHTRFIPYKTVWGESWRNWNMVVSTIDLVIS